MPAPRPAVCLIVLALLLFDVACGTRAIVLPDPDRLAPQVVIRRDTFGVPHILAATEEAAAFALGLAPAEDHAAEIGRRYIRARGQQALFFGARGVYGTFRVMRFDAIEGLPQRIAGNLEPGRPLNGFGDAWVLLVDFSRPVTGWSVLACGQTTDLASPHSRDQIEIFAARQLRRLVHRAGDSGPPHTRVPTGMNPGPWDPGTPGTSCWPPFKI